MGLMLNDPENPPIHTSTTSVLCSVHVLTFRYESLGHQDRGQSRLTSRHGQPVTLHALDPAGTPDEAHTATGRGIYCIPEVYVVVVT